MKTKMLFAVCALTLMNAAPANAQLARPVYSESEIIPGATYIITYQDTKKAFCTLNPRPYTKEHVYLFMPGSQTWTAIDEAFLAATTRFRIEKDGEGHWLLYNLNDQQYVGQVTNVPGATTLFWQSPQADENCHLTFHGDSQADFDIQIGTYYLRHSTTSSDYKLRSKEKEAGWAPVQLYQVRNAETTNLDLHEQQDMATGWMAANISLDRTFYNDFFNTLMVPFDISQPTEVFGDSVKIYGLKSIEQQKIIFRLLNKEEMIVHDQPYLLSGQFKEKPYLIQSTTFGYAGHDCAYANSGLTFHGVYHTGVDVGRSEAFILSRDTFYCCKTIDSMPVWLFKWYIIQDVQGGAKFFSLSLDDPQTNDIETIGSTEKKEKIYDLQGSFHGTDWQALPKGLYIRGHKKLVKH